MTTKPEDSEMSFNQRVEWSVARSLCAMVQGLNLFRSNVIFYTYGVFEKWWSEDFDHYSFQRNDTHLGF